MSVARREHGHAGDCGNVANLASPKLIEPREFFARARERYVCTETSCLWHRPFDSGLALRVARTNEWLFLNFYNFAILRIHSATSCDAAWHFTFTCITKNAAVNIKAKSLTWNCGFDNEKKKRYQELTKRANWDYAQLYRVTCTHSFVCKTLYI